MSNKQSSVEWLLSFIEPSLTPEQKHFFSIVIEQAKEMEKEGIKTAWYNGYLYRANEGRMPDHECVADTYYNETYGDNND